MECLFVHDLKKKKKKIMLQTVSRFRDPTVGVLAV
jgi:hypothetical protein